MIDRDPRRGLFPEKTIIRTDYSTKGWKKWLTTAPPYDRVSALNDLERDYKKWQRRINIAALVPILIRNLDCKYYVFQDDKAIANYSARILEKYGFDKIRRKDKNKIKVNALLTLGDDKDINKVLNMGYRVFPLMRKLMDKPLTEYGATKAFHVAAERGRDISIAVRHFVKMVKSDETNRHGQEVAASTLTFYHLGKGKVRKVMNLYKNGSIGIRKGVAYALITAAKRGKNISFAVPVFTDISTKFEKGEVYYRHQVDPVDLFLYHYINKKEHDKLEKLIEQEGGIEFVTERIEEFEKHLDADRFDVVQKAVESLYRRWLRKQPQGVSEEKIDMQIRFSELMMELSKRKAELSKKDGLLLGETVKKPKKSDKKIYRVRKAFN